jgi:hypothetical protein
MARSIAALVFIFGLCVSLRAEPVCVACEEPAAIYTCSFDPSLRDASLKLGRAIDGHVCEKVLAKTGPHARCRLMETSAPCEGRERTVTLADYQVAMAGDVESTYQPGMLEIARRRVYATWVCVTSMFNDC